METVTVNLITNKQRELQRFLSRYFQAPYPMEERTFRWTGIYPSVFQALDIIIVAAEADEDYLMQVVVNLPEFDAVVTHQNINDFIQYVYYRENQIS